MWLVVAFSLFAGGVAIAMTTNARMAATEDLQDVTKRWDALKAVAKEQPIEIDRLIDDRKYWVDLAKDCLVVIALQNQALKGLFRGPRTGILRGVDLDPYTDRARGLLIEFRQLLDGCLGS